MKLDSTVARSDHGDRRSINARGKEVGEIPIVGVEPRFSGVFS